VSEQMEELERNCDFLFCSIFLFNQAHMPEHWAWHICLLYMLCDDWASESHENLYLISRLGSEMVKEPIYLGRM
jgi:hypothetical protein